MPTIIRSLTLFALVVLTTWASDIQGVIEAIDDKNKTIKVNGTIIKVAPYTEIEQDSCGVGWDTHKTFYDLKVNDVVEVDIFYQDGTLIAKEIEIACWRAY